MGAGCAWRGKRNNEGQDAHEEHGTAPANRSGDSEAAIDFGGPNHTISYHNNPEIVLAYEQP